MSDIKKLERNRFSIITNNLEICYICGKKKEHLHEVCFGRNRRNSMLYGLVVPLCSKCHSEVHQNREKDIYLKQIAQRCFEKEYKENFLSIFHINYI